MLPKLIQLRLRFKPTDTPTQLGGSQGKVEAPVKPVKQESPELMKKKKELTKFHKSFNVSGSHYRYINHLKSQCMDKPGGGGDMETPPPHQPSLIPRLHAAVP